jgi:CRISPR system Cascade subunit CasB
MPVSRPDPPGNRVGQSLASLVGRLARAVEDELHPGDVASLRRMHPGAPEPLAFWKVAATYLDEALAGAGPYSESERRWAVILAAIAELRGLHQPTRRLGHALAVAGFSEVRLARLLRARGQALADATRTAVRFLATKGEPVDLADLARLVLSDGRRDEEQVRRQIARGFYGHITAS